MDADDAVIDFAGVAAPLPLNAGGFLAGFGMARIVNDADGLGVGVIARDDLLTAIAESERGPKATNRGTLGAYGAACR